MTFNLKSGSFIFIIILITILTGINNQQVPTIGYCLNIARLINKIDSKYLDININISSTNKLFMNGELNEESNTQKWTSKYIYPRKKTNPVELYNDETNSCLSTNNKGEVFLKQNDPDLWFMNFEAEYSYIRHVSTDLCLQLDLNGTLIAKKCEQSNQKQEWNIISLEESCIL